MTSTVTCSAPSGSGTTTIAIGSGTLSAAGVTLNGGSAGQSCAMTKGTDGVLTTTAGLTLTGTAAQISYVESGAGTINLTGTIGGTGSAGATFTVNSGSTLNITGASAINAAYTFGIVNVNTNTLTLGAGTITFAGTLLVANTATLSLGNFAFTQTGAVTVGSGTSGIISVAGAGSTGTYTFTGNITVNAGGIFNLSAGTHATSFAAGITSNGSSFSNGTGTATFATADQILQGSTALTFGGAVVVNSGVTVTVKKNTSMVGLTLNAAAVANGVSLVDPVGTGGVTLTNTGATTFSAPSAGVNSTLSVSSEHYTTTSISITGGTASGRNSILSISSGDITVSGDITCAATYGAQEQITFTGAGVINIAGNFASGANACTLTGGTGKVKMNSSTADKTLGDYTTYYDVEIATTGGYVITTEGATTITHNLTVTSGTLTLGADITVAGNWSNSGALTAGSSTVTLNGASSQTVTAGGSSFYDLTVVNTAGPTNGVTFNDGATISHIFSDTTADSKLIFHAGDTYAFSTFTITGSSSHLVTLTSSSTSQWNMSATTPSVSYADINYSNNTGASICATYSTSAHPETNTGWTITSDPACNEAPAVDVVSINPSPTIDLNPGATKTVTIAATITDNNGCEDVFDHGSITAVFYDANTVSDTCSQNDNNCYTNITLTEANSSCVTGTGDPSGDASATVDVWFIGNPSSNWTAKVMATDAASASGSKTSTVTINTLNAFAIDITEIDYETVDPNQISVEKVVLITTIGNAPIDVQLSGDNLTWSVNEILVGQQHYDLDSGIAWESMDGDGTNGTLTGTPTCVELASGKPLAHPSDAYDYVYWKLKVPTGKPGGGPYSGTNYFDVVSEATCP